MSPWSESACRTQHVFITRLQKSMGGKKRNDRPLPMTRVAAGVYRVKTADASIGESRIMCV